MYFILPSINYNMKIITFKNSIDGEVNYRIGEDPIVDLSIVKK